MKPETRNLKPETGGASPLQLSGLKSPHSSPLQVSAFKSPPSLPSAFSSTLLGIVATAFFLCFVVAIVLGMICGHVAARIAEPATGLFLFCSFVIAAICLAGLALFKT